MIAEPRRLAILEVHYDMLGVFFTTGNTPMCVEGLPVGACLVNLVADARRFVLILTYEHPSFAPAPEGAPIPMLDVEFTAREEIGA